MYNSNTDNIGVGEIFDGTNLPTAKFHIEGTTIPSNSGGNVLNDIFNDGFEDSTLAPFLNKPLNDLPWIVSTIIEGDVPGAGIYSAKTDSALEDNDVSRLVYTPTISPTAIAASVEFMVYTSTEGCCDKLTFYIDNQPSSSSFPAIGPWSGETSWTTITVPLIIGNTNKLEWEYVKDGSIANGEDIVAIDGVKIIETIPSTSTIGSYVFRLEDGQESDGKVLTSDADGNATWKSTSISRSSGKLDLGLNNELTNKPDEDFRQKTNAVFLNQQEKIKQLKNKISDLKKLANKLIKENK